MEKIKKLVVVMATVAFSFASSQVAAASYAKRLTTSTDYDPNCAWIWYKSYHNHYSPNRGGLTSDRTYEYHIVTETWHGSVNDPAACNYRRYDMEALVHNARLVAGSYTSTGSIYESPTTVEIMRTVNLRYKDINRMFYVGKRHADDGPAVCSTSKHSMKVKGQWFHRYWKVGSDLSACSFNY